MSTVIQYLFVHNILFIYDFTAAIAAHRSALSARAGWKRNRLQNTVEAWTLEMESVCMHCVSQLKVIMKWSFRNWIILILLIIVV